MTPPERLWRIQQLWWQLQREKAYTENYERLVQEIRAESDAYKRETMK